MRFAIRLSVAIAVVAAASLLSPRVAAAQSSPTGTLTGTIADPSGGVLPGVTVMATNTQTGPHATDGQRRPRVTGASRRCRLGTYEVTFELDGFKKLVRSGINCRRGADSNRAGHARSRRRDRNRRGDRRRAAARRDHGGHVAEPDGRRIRGGSDVDRQLHAPAVVGSRRQRRSAAGPDQRHRQHLAVGERHANHEHEPVLQRHRRHQPDDQRRRDERQHLAGARHAAGSQAADQHVRRLDRPVRRRQLPARHPQRQQRASAARRCSTSSTRA